MTHRWQLPGADTVAQDNLVRELGIDPLIARCLANRRVTTAGDAERFLHPKLKAIGDPFDIPNMGSAVERIAIAREKKERVVIFGDYDVDGVTSTCLIIEVLKAVGISASPYLPHRFEEGYGLTRDGVENCLKALPSPLLIAVDCGSTSVESIQWLKGQGTDVIVLDHHQVSDPAPPAHALVNPRLDGPEGRNNNLCSVGLAFKLAHALVKWGRELGWPEAATLDIRQWLDLVALGTIADQVPLTGENRIFVSTGLERLAQTGRPGIQALKEVSGISSPVTVTQVGFQMAPRLNAAGRLEDATDALRLLLADSPGAAVPLAKQLDNSNRERQQIERAIADAASKEARDTFKLETDFVVVLGRAEWHIGVVGIVAGRLQREFHRPAIVMGAEGETWRGSGRSIEGFDLAGALRECDDLLERHGGHAMAAGLSLKPGNLEAFRARLNSLAAARLTPDQLQPTLRLDGEIQLSSLTLELMDSLTALEPHGQGNPPIQFCARNLSLAGPLNWIGKESQHLKMRISDGKTTFDTLYWNAPKDFKLPKTFQLAFAPQLNEYNGWRSIQLKYLDWCDR